MTQSLLRLLDYSVADPGCLSRRYPGFEFSYPGSRVQEQKDTRIRIHVKEFKYFNPKICFQALGNVIQNIHPGSGSCFFTHPGFQIQGSKRHRIPHHSFIIRFFSWKSSKSFSRCCELALVSMRIQNRIPHFRSVRFIWIQGFKFNEQIL
jgi:hypothetical protein